MYAIRSYYDKVEIVSDEGVEWRQKEQIVTTLGRSSAKRGNVTILADKLMAAYQSTEGTPYDIQKINGEGNVVITSDKEQAYGDNVEYSLKDALMILVGSPAKIKMPEELILARDKIEYYGNDKKAIAYGNATIIKNKSKITADNRITSYNVCYTKLLRFTCSNSDRCCRESCSFV